MRKLFNVLRNIFAILGVLFVVLVILLHTGVFEVNMGRSEKSALNSRIRALKTSGPYLKDTMIFSINAVRDSVRAAEIRGYFCLDTLYDASAPTWDKAVAIARFVADNIPHANQKIQPEKRNAIALWEYTRNVEPGINCRLHSIMLFEMLTSVGIDATYVTCLPKKDDGDCHVVNQVWLPELGKWVMIDSDSGGYYATDVDGNLLSLREIRENYVSGAPVVYHPGFGEAGESVGSWYFAYMAKNTYWFAVWENIHYDQESGLWGSNDGSYLVLIPSGYEPFSMGTNVVPTSDADRFWAAPELK